jgi:hypothetical protein
MIELKVGDVFLLSGMTDFQNSSNLLNPDAAEIKTLPDKNVMIMDIIIKRKKRGWFKKTIEEKYFVFNSKLVDWIHSDEYSEYIVRSLIKNGSLILPKDEKEALMWKLKI